MTFFSQKTALVTGAAQRIGKAVALALAAQGARVILHYCNHESAAHATLDEITHAGGEAHVLQADFATGASDLFDRAIRISGSVDLLVNSAALWEQDTAQNATLETLCSQTAVNAFAPLELIRQMAALNKPGAVVNLLDARMHAYDREHLSYQLSKQMLETITRTTALEFAPELRINGVAPGLILPPAGKDDSWLEERKHSNPLQSAGHLDEVVQAVLFLLENRFITGQIIYVDGGRHLRGITHAT